MSDESDKNIPNMVTDLPGEKSAEFVKMAEKYVPKGLYTVTPAFISESRGAIIEDLDGNRYIDFATGIASLNVGHRPPKVMEAIQKQLDKYLHACYHVTPYAPYVEMAKQLVELAPGDFSKKALFLNSGAEAVENAVKIAINHTQRPRIIAFGYAFHGRTRLAMGLTASVQPYKKGFGVLDRNIFRTPYAYCYRCPFGCEYPDCGLQCLKFLEDNLELHVSPSQIAAMMVEPIQGEGGFVVPPEGFLSGLRRICDEHNIVMIADEIQTGLGRAGKMFAIDHFDVVPDVITLAKTLGGGLPLSAVISKTDIVESVHEGGLGTTFGGNPVSLVAGMETVKIAQENLDHANEMGEVIQKRFDEWYDKYEFIGDTRGLGMMRAIELVKDRSSKEPAKGLRSEILAECHKNGLIVIGAGPHKNVIRFLPAINIDEEILDKGLDIIEDALQEVS
ncbi:MAG: aspartate aminotransferase family protein [Candidatus Thorarchaeota archaeon]|nr:aspartate aminotransferase family protein [Candidatus Thorarchaeota archaeon]